MKNITINTFKKLIFICSLGLFLFSINPVNSQVIFDDDVDDQAPGAPIDGLIGLGLAAGAWYGIKKLKAGK